MDVFCGANKDTRMAIRFIMEVAWQAHFVKNMFIQPTAEELENFEPDFISFNASKAKVENYKELGLNSETAVVFNLTDREQVILNTWYGGEMKKGMFSMMNYYLPLKGMASMHCSANTDMNGENTALSSVCPAPARPPFTDPKRLLIGDDEHGWDDNGVFNFEGGCYAKVIDLDKDSEPDIYNAIKRNALLENVTLDENGKIDFHDKSVTENTRVSYPIDHIEKIVRPVSAGPDAKNVIFLSADAFGVLPPVSIPDPGADRVLLPVRFHLQAGRHRARHHRAHPDLLRLLRPGLPRTASHQVCGGTGQEDAEVRREGVPRQHRLERHRQAHLHQGYPRASSTRSSTAPSRLRRPRPSPTSTLKCPPSCPALTPAHPRPARHLCRRGPSGMPSQGSGFPLPEELRQVRKQRSRQGPCARRSAACKRPPAA